MVQLGALSLNVGYTFKHSNGSLHENDKVFFKGVTCELKEKIDKSRLCSDHDAIVFSIKKMKPNWNDPK